MPFDGTTSPAAATLIKARGFIERGWCKYAMARDARGVPVDGVDRSAVSWCLIGAMEAAAGGLHTEAYRQAAKVMVLSLQPVAAKYAEVRDFNNAQKNRLPVLRAFDRAISLALAEGR